MIIGFHKKFIKGYRRLSPKLQEAVDDKIRLFSADPMNETLNNHALTAEYECYRSINITGDYRALYRMVSKNEAVFVLIGTHAQIYG